MSEIVDFETIEERKLRQEDFRTRLESMIGRGQARLELYIQFMRCSLAVQCVIERDLDNEGIPELDLVCLLTLYLREKEEPELFAMIREDLGAQMLYTEGEGKETRYFLAKDARYIREGLR